MQTKKIMYIAAITALILLIPLFGNQFVEGGSWTLFDFVLAGTLIFGAILTYELGVKKIRTPSYRAVAIFALAFALLLIWIDGAVGIIDDEGSRQNSMAGAYRPQVLRALS